MAGPDDTTRDSALTYAELTQTQAWAGAPTLPISAPQVERSGAERYETAAVLGMGGMGKVLLARDARVGRDVALKVLRSDREMDAEERERFLREAQVQGQLEHPSIVPVYDIDRNPDGSTFFTMRRVLGRTLGQVLEEVKTGASKVTLRELLQAFSTVCLTVDYAHSRGVVHRDLKPANIMLGDFGEVYVLDWGLARILQGTRLPSVAEPPQRLSMPGVMMGTPMYMAPEQMADPDVGPEADVFSLGAILFEILTGKKLRDVRALYAPVEARPSVRAPEAKVPPELETICVKATMLDATERLGTARALQEAVARYLEGDRELEQRRVLAAGHATRAKDALKRAEDANGEAYEQERGMAIRELVRALALEPTNREHVATLAEVMAQRPAVMPAAVAREIETEDHEVVRRGARYTMLAMLSWLLFFPIIGWAGVREGKYVALIAGSVALTGGFAYLASRWPVKRWLQVGVLVAMVSAGMSLSRVFGPLILVPTMFVTWTIVVQAHPDPSMRRLGFAICLVGLVVPLLLEVLGIVPASYRFVDGLMVVVPQMTNLPEQAVYGFLTIANLGIGIMPALFIGRLRDQLARAQAYQRVQTWHFKRIGEDLTSAAA